MDSIVPLAIALIPSALPCERITLCALRVTNSATSPLHNLKFQISSPSGSGTIILGKRSFQVPYLSASASHDFDLEIKPTQYGQCTLLAKTVSFLCEGKPYHFNEISFPFDVLEGKYDEGKLSIKHLYPLELVAESFKETQWLVHNRSDKRSPELHIAVSQPFHCQPVTIPSLDPNHDAKIRIHLKTEASGEILLTLKAAARGKTWLEWSGSIRVTPKAEDGRGGDTVIINRVQPTFSRQCRNGHPINLGDVYCPDCGERIS